MTAIIGFILVILAVFGGYAAGGGHLFLIFKPWYEFLIIGGAALGGLIVKTSPRTLKLVWQKSLAAFKHKPADREVYMEALKLIHDLTLLARRDGLMALESHLMSPPASAIFTKYPRILERTDLVKFIGDSLMLTVIGGINPADLAVLMDSEIETLHEERAAPQMILANTADALPALGIVAAVMGIIKTMASIAEGPEVVGTKVAAALVGTFLGVLLSYGFVGPLAVNVEMANQEEERMLQVFKAGVLGLSRGLNPRMSAEYARRAIYEGQRPSFEELEQMFKVG